MGDAHRYDITPRWGWCIKLLSGYYVFYAGWKPATVHAVGTTYGKLGVSGRGVFASYKLFFWVWYELASAQGD